MPRQQPITAPARLVLGHDLRGPWFEYRHTIADVSAVQAIANGTATPDQQVRAFDWIVRTAAATWQDTFHPESERVATFMQGRRFVGLKLLALRELSVNDLLKRENPNATLSEQGD